MEQELRNEIACDIVDKLNSFIPKPNIFDCLDILQNLTEGYIKELEFNINQNDKPKTKRKKK